jgi:hypothetical protein
MTNPLPDGVEKPSPFVVAALAKGHDLKRDEDGDVDIFVVDVGYHNGPGCIACGWDACMHCDGIDKIPECTEAARAEEASRIAASAARKRLIDAADDLLAFAKWVVDSDPEGQTSQGPLFVKARAALSKASGKVGG